MTAGRRHFSISSRIDSLGCHFPSFPPLGTRTTDPECARYSRWRFLSGCGLFFLFPWRTCGRSCDRSSRLKLFRCTPRGKVICSLVGAMRFVLAMVIDRRHRINWRVRIDAFDSIKNARTTALVIYIAGTSLNGSFSNDVIRLTSR